MSISLSCSQCAQKLRAPDHFAGRTIRCPACQAPLHIPAPEPVVAESALMESGAEESDGSETYRLSHSTTSDGAPPVMSATPRGAEFESDSGLPPLPGKKPKSRKAPRPRLSQSPGFREYCYLFLALALLPLALSTIMDGSADLEERIQRTVSEHPELESVESADELFSRLPEGRIDGAHLARDTWMHWIYAALSAGLFLALLLLAFPPGWINARTLLGVGLFTGTVGILMLLAFQWVAIVSQGVWLRGRGVFVLIMLIIKFIGFSYRCALEDGNGFLLSVIGFTCGVGLCEELCKAIPIVWYLRTARDASWRGAVLVGLASGVGFGVSEGITYSSDYYNGLSTWGIYVVRFVSCVGLHATWSGAVALLMYKNQDYLQGDLELVELAQAVAIYLGASMLLHGLYDTLLKQELNLWALAIAAGSFGWLVWLIECMRAEFDEAYAA